MHKSCYEWVGGIVEKYRLAGHSTIEIGSCNVNGTVRDFFNGAYIGVDIGPGDGVDRIEDCESLSDPDAQWFNVISTEALEHVGRPWRAVAEMARICQPSGYVIVTCRGYDTRGCWQIHSYPHDVWRMSDNAMRIMAEDAGLEVLEITNDPEGPGWFMACRKQ